MDSTFPVFDLSSDDEPVAIDNPNTGGDDDHNWLTDILKTVDKVTDDSDDVFILQDSDYKFSKKRKSMENEVVVVNVDDEDDDDCVVLEIDPCKPLDVGNGVNKDVEDDNDVVVVGQKGQIACRDYPHPRHDCAKFPFNSGPHEKYCKLCHCYVCDSLAPCAFWGTGLSSGDHCHANDKQEIWKSLRQTFRQVKYTGTKVSCAPAVSNSNQILPQYVQVASLGGRKSVSNMTAQNQVSRPIGIRACTSLNALNPNIINEGRTQPTVSRNYQMVPPSIQLEPLGGGQLVSNLTAQNQVSRPTAIRACASLHGFIPNIIDGGRNQLRVSCSNQIVPQSVQVASHVGRESVSNLTAQNQVSRPTAVRACTTSNSFIPNIINKGRNQPAGYVQGRNTLLPSVSLQPCPFQNHSTGRVNFPVTGDADQQFVSSKTTSNTLEVARGPLPINQCVSGSSHPTNCAPIWQCYRNAVSSPDVRPPMWQNAIPNLVLQPLNYQNPPQFTTGSNIVNAVPSGPKVNTLSEVHLPTSNNSQNLYPHRNQNQDVISLESNGTNNSQVNISSQNSHQIPMGNNVLDTTKTMNGASTIEQVIPQRAGETVLQDRGYDNPFSDPSVPVTSEGSVPTDVKIFSPDSFSTDTGLLYFDFFPPYDGLTNL